MEVLRENHKTRVKTLNHMATEYKKRPDGSWRSSWGCRTSDVVRGEGAHLRGREFLAKKSWIVSLIRAGVAHCDRGRDFDVSDLVAFALVFVAVFAGERDGERAVLVAVNDQDRETCEGRYTPRRFPGRGDRNARRRRRPFWSVPGRRCVRSNRRSTCRNVDAVTVDL